MNALVTSCTPGSTFMTMDERLKQLVQQAQQYPLQSEERQLALTQLVDEILRYAARSLRFVARACKIARPPSGQTLFGIYKDIYEQVRQKLLHNIDEKLNNYNPTRIPVRIWINDLRNRTYQEVLNDEQLKKLALEAQQHPPLTELRQYALGELVEAIRLSGKLAHPHRERFSPQFYDLIYEEAVNKTLTYVCRKINNYDPERGNRKFMNWVNFRLDRYIIESYHEFKDPRLSELPSLSHLEMIVQQEEPSSLFEMVRERIEEDSENVFKQAHIKNRPDANFQAIALARLSGKTWEEISVDFQISISTLSVFFQRCCHKFRSQFREEWK